MSAFPFLYWLSLMAENGALIAAVTGTVGAVALGSYLASDPKNRQAVISSLGKINEAVGQVGNQIVNMSIPAANEALKQLDQTRQQLKAFQEKLLLIDKALPIAKEFLGKVTRLLQKIDQVSGNLSDRVKVNPGNIDSPIPPTYSDSPVREIPVVRDVGSSFENFVPLPQEKTPPPFSSSKPTPTPSNPPISNRQDRVKPNPAPVYYDDPLNPPISTGFPESPSFDRTPWVPANRTPIQRPISPSGDRTLLPNNTPINVNPIDFPNTNTSTKPVTKVKPISRTKPKVDTNQPGCKDPNSWSEKFKQFLEFAIDQLGQELIQTMADRAGEVFNKAFAARDEAKRKNPDFDKGKPDLKKTLENSIGKEFDKLSPQTQKDLREYYRISPQPDGRNVISRIPGRGSDPTLPPIQIKSGIVIPELLANNNRLSSGVDLGKEFAKGHGFNPTKSGVLKTASNGKTLSQTAAIKSLIGPVQIHHKITDALWQSHPLTKAIQAKIDAGSKSMLGLNHSSNLIAAYKSPEAKAAYQKMLAEIGKTDPQLKTSIEGNLSKLESGKAMLSDLYHNGSHDGWNQRARTALTKQVDLLKLKFKTKDLSKIPEKDLNAAYKRVIKELGDELHEANKKITQKQPLDENEKKWLTPDYCSPKDKQKTNPGTRISVNPDKGTSLDSLMAATERSSNLNQKSNSNQLASTSQNSQSLQAENTGQKVRQNPIESPIWAKTINLANQLKKSSNSQELTTENTGHEMRQVSTRDLVWTEIVERELVWTETIKLANEMKASSEARLARKEEQQVASQQQEITKQQKRGFERG
jgi:hypothetical protein